LIASTNIMLLEQLHYVMPYW